jgi:tetratricopeptide (TPR) repeat protein
VPDPPGAACTFGFGGRLLAANKRKILENARKLAQKGAKAKALAEYEKLVKLDPRDAKLRLEIGDAHRRWGQVEQAIETYARVAEQYTKEGFDARAVAVYKQILNLDPERHDAYEPLAELYERMGLTAEAISALQTAADGHHREGRKREALELLRRLSVIDPTNTTSRVKVAELLRQEGMNAEAVAEYEQVAQELARQGDVETAAKLYRRVLELEPGRTSAIARFARTLLDLGKTDEAESLAKRALAADEDEPAHYELLADVYRAQGRESSLAEIYRPLADLYRRRGDEERARAILQRFVPPETISLREESPSEGDVGFLDSAGPDSGAEFGEPLPMLEDELSANELSFQRDLTPELELGPELEIGRADGDAGQDDLLEDEPPVAPAPARPAPRTPSGDPDQLLAEASVYLRYGNRDKALAHLQAILDQEPDHRLALEKLGETHAESAEPELAVGFWLRAAKVARQEGDASRGSTRPRRRRSRRPPRRLRPSCRASPRRRSRRERSSGTTWTSSSTWTAKKISCSTTIRSRRIRRPLPSR